MVTLLRLTALVIFILILVRLKTNISLIILFLIIITSILFNLSLSEIKNSTIKALTSTFTYKLLGMIIIILFLEKIMEKEKLFDDVVKFFSSFKNKKWSLYLPPAIIGLLPMPAGALVSAPFVKFASKNFKLSQSEKTFLNYWFRHIWEYFWPLYPGILLMSIILEIPIRKIILYHIPLTIAAISIGLILTLPLLKENKKKEKTKIYFKGILPLTPILLIIFLTIFLKLNFLISLLLGLLMTIIIAKTPFKKLLKLFFKSLNPTIIFMILFVMIFKEIVISADIFSHLQAEIQLSKTANYFIVTFLAFITGFLTGINQIYVGVTFPMLSSLFKGKVDFAWVMIVYTFGFLGVLLTPTHLCLSLTKEYFKANWSLIYKKLLFSVLFLALFSISYFFILKLNLY